MLQLASHMRVPDGYRWIYIGIAIGIGIAIILITYLYMRKPASDYEAFYSPADDYNKSASEGKVYGPVNPSSEYFKI